MDPRPTLFASDLHLSAERPEKVSLFERMMAHAGGTARAVYLLGDLVEAWLGDDDQEPPNRQLVAAIAAVTAVGVPVWVLHGNRDFLLGARFAEASGAGLLGEETRIDLYGEPALLLHGDTLCLEDTDYQALRRTVRDPAWQQAVLARPLAERRAMAAHLRAGSRAAMSGKDEFLMDVTERAVEEAFARNEVRLMIHGHTHRPGIHELPAPEGGRRRRIVLPDWYEGDGLLLCRPGEQRLLRVEEFLAAPAS